MSRQLINRSQDLRKLRDEGFDLDVRAGYLLVRGVPYLTTSKVIKYGTLVSELKTAGDVTAQPDNHVAHFAGEYPCTVDGLPIAAIGNSSKQRLLAEGVEIDHTFSARPKAGKYIDYHEKVTTYVAIIENQARAVDSNVAARSFAPAALAEDESVFLYEETASSRAGISRAAEKLRMSRIAVVGLGGTGSYVLDLLAKCPVGELHLFDGDRYYTHNAFRSPGAASLEDLRAQPNKAAYWASVYSRMRRNILPHEYYINETTVGDLDGMDFVFLCLDRGKDKRLIVDHLLSRNTSFIDVGMGISNRDDSLLGIVRVTAATPDKKDHIPSRLSFADGDALNEYSTNIQIADLNALNAALAVIKWKKICGFYLDLEREHFVAYTLDGNAMVNEDTP